MAFILIFKVVLLSILLLLNVYIIFLLLKQLIHLYKTSKIDKEYYKAQQRKVQRSI